MKLENKICRIYSLWLLKNVTLKFNFSWTLLSDFYCYGEQFSDFYCYTTTCKLLWLLLIYLWTFSICFSFYLFSSRLGYFLDFVCFWLKKYHLFKLSYVFSMIWNCLIYSLLWWCIDLVVILCYWWCVNLHETSLANKISKSSNFRFFSYLP